MLTPEWGGGVRHSGRSRAGAVPPLHAGGSLGVSHRNRPGCMIDARDVSVKFNSSSTILPLFHFARLEYLFSWYIAVEFSVKMFSRKKQALFYI